MLLLLLLLQLLLQQIMLLLIMIIIAPTTRSTSWRSRAPPGYTVPEIAACRYMFCSIQPALAVIDCWLPDPNYILTDFVTPQKMRSGTEKGTSNSASQSSKGEAQVNGESHSVSAGYETIHTLTFKKPGFEISAEAQHSPFKLRSCAKTI